MSSQPSGSARYERLAATDGRPITVRLASGSDTALFELRDNVYSLKATAYNATSGAKNAYVGKFEAIDGDGNLVPFTRTRNVTQMEATQSKGLLEITGFNTGTGTGQYAAGTRLDVMNTAWRQQWRPGVTDAQKATSGFWALNSDSTISFQGASKERSKAIRTPKRGGSPIYSLRTQCMPGDGNYPSFSWVMLFNDANGDHFAWRFTRLGQVLSNPTTEQLNEITGCSISSRLHSGVDWSESSDGGAIISGGSFNNVKIYRYKPTTIYCQYDEIANTLTMWSEIPPSTKVVYSLKDKVFPGRGYGLGWAYDDGPEIHNHEIGYNVAYGQLSEDSTDDSPITYEGADFRKRLIWSRNAPSRIQFQQLDPVNLSPVSDWITCTTSVVKADSSGTSGTVDVTGTVPFVQGTRFRWRYYDDTDTVLTSPKQINFGIKKVPPIIGANFISANYYAPYSPLNNWGKFAALKPDQGVGVVYIPYAGINGKSEITTQTGITLNRTDPFGSNIEIVSTNPSTGKHVINVKRDQQWYDYGNGDNPLVGQHRWLSFSAMPTKFDVVYKDRTAEVNDDWVEWTRGLQGLRDLDIVGTNFVRVTENAAATQFKWNDESDPFYYGGFSGGFMPFGQLCRVLKRANQLNPDFKFYWHTIPAIITDDRARAEAIAARDTLPSNMEIALELGNEVPWNFTEDTGYFFRQAVMAGYWGNYTPKNPAPVSERPQTIPTAYGWNPKTGASNLPAIPAGTIFQFYLDGTGWAFMKTLKDAPAKQPVDDTTTFQRMPYGSYTETPRIWGSQRMYEIGLIWREVFGDAEFKRRVIVTRMGQSIDNVDWAQQQRIDITVVPEFTAMLGGIGWGTYVYPKGVDTNNGTWTVQMVHDAYMTDIGPQRERIRSLKATADPRAWRVMIYEGINAHRVNGNQSFSDAFTLYKRDPLISDLIEASVINHRRELGDGAVAMFFNRFGDREWSLQVDGGDINSPIMAGFKRGMAASLS